MNKQPRIPKFDRKLRTFETRVTFIRDIFTSKYDNIDIMASSVRYKLDKSFENYLVELENSKWSLYDEDPIKVLKAIDKNDN